MRVALYVAEFFDEVSAVWDAVPGSLKVFLYALTTIVATQFINDEFSVRSIATAVLINLGLYIGPREVNNQVQRLK